MPPVPPASSQPPPRPHHGIHTETRPARTRPLPRPVASNVPGRKQIKNSIQKPKNYVSAATFLKRCDSPQLAREDFNTIKYLYYVDVFMFNYVVNIEAQEYKSLN